MMHIILVSWLHYWLILTVQLRLTGAWFPLFSGTTWWVWSSCTSSCRSAAWRTWWKPSGKYSLLSERTRRGRKIILPTPPCSQGRCRGLHHHAHKVAVEECTAMSQGWCRGVHRHAHKVAVEECTAMSQGWCKGLHHHAHKVGVDECTAMSQGWCRGLHHHAHKVGVEECTTMLTR